MSGVGGFWWRAIRLYKGLVMLEIVPRVGIGKVRLGMLREEADWLLERGMKIDSGGNPPVVTFIQVSHRAWATYRGVDVFDEDSSADEVVATIVRLEGLDPADYPPGRHEYLFPSLNMILWRGEVTDEPGDQGYTFQAASIHVPGYYQNKPKDF
jgi:hypothetical protein